MKRFLDYLPILYSLLIFIGYYNYWSYYNFFHIDISSYLSFGELLLSFLQVSNVLLIIFGILVLFILTVIFQIRFEKQENTEEINPTDIFEDISTFFKNVLRLTREKTTFKNLFFLILNFIVLITGVILLLLWLGFIYIFFDNVFFSETIKNAKGMLILSLLWFILSFKIIKLKNEIQSNTSATLILIILTFGLITISNKEKAYYIKNGNPMYNVEVFTKTDTITTNNTLLFIGRTQDYIYFYNKSNQNNIVIKNEDVIKIHQNKNFPNN